MKLLDKFGTDCSLVAAKARVASLRLISISRMELQAAVLRNRLACNVMKILNITIQRKFLKTVLYGLNTDLKRFRQFRVGEILDTTDIDE